MYLPRIRTDNRRTGVIRALVGSPANRRRTGNLLGSGYAPRTDRPAWRAGNTGRQPPMTASTLDRDLVDAFVTGALDQPGERMLAEQVARVLPWHWTLPNPGTAALAKLVKHLGGEPALYSWLGRQPGYPRLVAQIYHLVGLLDRISDQPAVVDELARLRERDGTPAELTAYITPDTTSGTLASLSEQIESLLTDEPDEALRVALATVDLLRQVAPRVAGAEPDLHDLGDQLDRVDRDLTDAARSRPAAGWTEGAP